MVRTVLEDNLKAFDGEACQGSVLHSLAEPFFNGRDKLLRHVSSPYLIHECKSRSIILGRHDCNGNIRELAFASGLLLKDFPVTEGCCDSLFVCHLGPALVAFNLELSLQTVNKYFEVKLAHAANHCLSAVRIGFDPECGIFFGEFSESNPQLVNISLRLWL